MTITQPVNPKQKVKKDKKNKTQSKANPTCSMTQETSFSCTAALTVHSNSGVQHTSIVAPIPRQHQPSLQQFPPPWWAWGLPPPPMPWNWNMWSPGAFHQLTLSNQQNWNNQIQQGNIPAAFPNYPLMPPSVTV